MTESRNSASDSGLILMSLKFDKEQVLVRRLYDRERFDPSQIESIILKEHHDVCQCTRFMGDLEHQGGFVVPGRLRRLFADHDESRNVMRAVFDVSSEDVERISNRGFERSDRCGCRFLGSDFCRSRCAGHFHPASLWQVK